MAVLALLVLVVLITIFGGRIGDFFEGSRDCRTINGVCELRPDCEFGKNTIHSGTDCSDMNEKDTPSDEQYICCAPLLG